MKSLHLKVRVDEYSHPHLYWLLKEESDKEAQAISLIGLGQYYLELMDELNRAIPSDLLDKIFKESMKSCKDELLVSHIIQYVEKSLNKYQF